MSNQGDSIFKSKSDHVLVDFLEIIVQGLIDTSYMTDHDSTTTPFRWNVCLFRLWGRRLQFLPRTLRVDCLDTDVFLGDLQLEPISAKNDCLMEHFTPTLLYLGVLIVLHCLSILSRTTFEENRSYFLFEVLCYLCLRSIAKSVIHAILHLFYIYPLVIYNIAMEAMAHRHRWCTYSKWWIFPWLC